MLRKMIATISLFILGLVMTSGIVLAQEPAQSDANQSLFPNPNNQEAVHLISPTTEDVVKACNLVNANGGAWGWLIWAIREDELDADTLKDFIDTARDQRCQIVFRLATSFDKKSGSWRRPTKQTIDKFVKLFKETATKTTMPLSQFFILDNEMNHGDEYGGACDPADYAHWAQAAKEEIKREIKGAVVILGALDKAAPQAPPNYCEWKSFYTQMYKAEPRVFDGAVLASHDYPPNMTGSALASGERSVVGYKTEKEFLQGLGVPHAMDMDVFITETGWNTGAGGVSQEYAAEQMNIAMARWKADDHLIAHADFVFKACGEPFAKFSLVNCETGNRTAVGNMIFDSQKIVGEPHHEYQATTLTTLSKYLVADRPYTFDIQIMNKSTDNFRGNEYKLGLINADYEHSFTTFDNVRPGGTLATTFTFNPGPAADGALSVRLGLYKRGKLLMQLFEWQPIVKKAQFRLTDVRDTFGGMVDGVKGQVQFFDANEQLVSRAETTIQNGVLYIPDVKKVDYDNMFRWVLLVDERLPQQGHIRFLPEGNTEQAQPMLKIDKNRDGQFTLGDLLSLYQ